MIGNYISQYYMRLEFTYNYIISLQCGYYIKTESNPNFSLSDNKIIIY